MTITMLMVNTVKAAMLAAGFVTGDESAGNP